MRNQLDLKRYFAGFKEIEKLQLTACKMTSFFHWQEVTPEKRDSKANAKIKFL